MNLRLRFQTSAMINEFNVCQREKKQNKNNIQSSCFFLKMNGHELLQELYQEKNGLIKEMA